MVPIQTSEFSEEFKKQFREDTGILKEKFLDFLTYGLDNFVGIVIGATVVIGGLWLAVTTGAGAN